MDLHHLRQQGTQIGCFWQFQYAKYLQRFYCLFDFFFINAYLCSICYSTHRVNFCVYNLLQRLFTLKKKRWVEIVIKTFIGQFVFNLIYFWLKLFSSVNRKKNIYNFNTIWFLTFSLQGKFIQHTVQGHLLSGPESWIINVLSHLVDMVLACLVTPGDLYPHTYQL